VIGSLARPPARSNQCRRPGDWLPARASGPGSIDTKWPHELGLVGTQDLDFAPQPGRADAVEACTGAATRAAYKRAFLARVTAHVANVLHHAPLITPHCAPPPLLTPRSHLPSPVLFHPPTVGLQLIGCSSSPTLSPCSVDVRVRSLFRL
jgi:hypothetical protein